MSRQLKLLNLTAYLDQYGKDEIAPLFVVNTSASMNEHGAGNVAFTANDEFNRPAAVVVPRTFIPVDLTQSVPRKSLLVSARFRSLLSRGAVRIVDNKSAEEYLQTDENAQKEYERIFNTTYGDQGTLDMGEMEESIKTTVDSVPENVAVTDNHFVQSIITRAQGKEANAEELVNAIRNQGLNISKDDLQIIADRVTLSEVKDFCLGEIKAIEELEAEQA